jgi:hypothetical protein
MLVVGPKTCKYPEVSSVDVAEVVQYTNPYFRSHVSEISQLL